MKNMMITLLPIFMIILIGIVIRKLNLLGESVINGLKTIIVKIALPGVLFMTFAKASLAKENTITIVLIFFFCVLLYLIGTLLHKLLPQYFPDQYTNAYFTGFEFGMIGIGVFSAIWGIDSLSTFAIIALGHEVFIWFVYVPVLDMRKTGLISIKKTFLNFIKTPTIIGIILGILVNILDLYRLLETSLIGQSLINGLTMLGNVISPLILIVIGYNLTFKKVPIYKTFTTLSSRWIVVLGLGFGLTQLIQYAVPTVPSFLITAIYAFILLPPPYILPLYINGKAKEEVSYYSEILVYYTALSFLGYIVLLLWMA